MATAKCIATFLYKTKQFIRRAPVLSAAFPYSFSGRYGKRGKQGVFCVKVLAVYYRCNGGRQAAALRINYFVLYKNVAIHFAVT